MKNRLMRGIFSAFMIIAFLAGCAAQVPTEDSLQEVRGADMEAETAGEGVAQEEEMPASAVSEVSDRETAVSYTGEPFIKSVFAVGGEMLWLYGIKDDGNFFLGYMGKEEDVFQETDVSPGADMRAFNMVVDRQGRCHILWISVQKETIDGREFDRITFDRSCITIIDSSGKTEKEIQVSDIFSEEQGQPYCFVVDEAGNYYFENGMQLIQILPDGTQGGTFPCAESESENPEAFTAAVKKRAELRFWKNWKMENCACAASNCPGRMPSMQEFMQGQIQNCCFSIKILVFLPFRTVTAAWKPEYLGQSFRYQGKKSQAMAFWGMAGHVF